MSRNWSNIWRGAAVALVLTAGLLSGCTTPTVQARVTSFQQWPAGVEGQTYRFVDAVPGQAGNLEYQTYRDALRASIGPTGLVEARADQQARFKVSFDYGAEQTQVMVRRAYDPYFYGGFGGFYGPPWWGGGMGYWGPEWVDVPAVAYRNRLSVQIHDTARGGAEVYRATAYIVTNQADLVRAMPFLARAIFDSFPGNNGSERQVEFPLAR